MRHDTHLHHIIPKHMGGSDDLLNLIELSIEDHAMAHKQLYEKYGHWQDYIAWKGLAGIIGKEDLIHEVKSLASKENLMINGNPWSGRRTSANWALNLDLQQKAVLAAKSKESREKRKQTFARIEHAQGKNNSQFGTSWCIPKDAPDLSRRKKFKRDQIPDGWITTTEWKKLHHNSIGSTAGLSWYNDGKNSFMLSEEDPGIRTLTPGRLKP